MHCCGRLAAMDQCRETNTCAERNGRTTAASCTRCSSADYNMLSYNQKPRQNSKCSTSLLLENVIYHEPATHRNAYFVLRGSMCKLRRHASVISSCQGQPVLRCVLSCLLPSRRHNRAIHAVFVCVWKLRQTIRWRPRRALEQYMRVPTCTRCEH